MWEVIGDWIPIILLFILLFVFILSILFFLQKEGVFLSLFSSQYSSANYPFQVWVTLWFNEVLYWFGLGTSYSLPFLHSHFASSPEILAYLDSLGMGKKQKKRQEVTVSDRVVMRTLSMLWLEEPKLNLFGRAHLQELLVTTLKTRSLLRTLETQMKSPDWANFFSDPTTFSKSLIVCGLPRTGSSMLNHLLVQDSQIWTPDRSLLFTPHSLLEDFLEKFEKGEESFEKEEEKEEEKGEGDPSSSFSRLPQKFQMFIKMVPKILTVYPWIVMGGPVEDLNLLERLGVQYFLHFVNGKPYHDLSDEEWRAIYLDFSKVIRAVLWLQKTKKEYQCFKCQCHLLGLSEMMKVFPKANVIILHRNPLECISSTTSMYSMFSSNMYSTVHHPSLLQSQIKRIESNTKCALKFTKPNPRILHLRYQDLVQDPIEAVRMIYEKFRIPYSEEFQIAMQTWIKKHPRGVFGKHEYNQVTLSESTKEKFAEYSDTFGV